MSPPYPEVTVVSLPSSFMIVISFTPSYSLLAYLLQFLGTVKLYDKIHLFSLLFYHKACDLFFQHIIHLQMLSLKVIRSFSHRNNLKIIYLEAVT
jgi:hypothetical protein